MPRILTTLLLLASLSFVPPAQPQLPFSATLKIRKLRNGSLLTYTAQMLYKEDGELITYFPEPNNYYSITSPQGDLTLFNPVTRKASVTRLKGLSSQGASMHYFLTGRTGDMDLPSMGYTLSGTREEAGSQVATWVSEENREIKGATHRVELVSRQGRLIYMGYYTGDDFLWRKSYYTSYTQLEDVQVPTRITEVTYLSPADSILEDTQYTDLATGAQANPTLLQFTLPDDAILD